MNEHQPKNPAANPDPDVRPAPISSEELPDSIDHGEDVSMGPGAVLPGRPGLSRPASKLVEPEDEDPEARR